MSNVIEDRIVEMKFDNSDFEKNVSTSMNTLDRLKKALNFSNVDSADTFKGLQKAADNVSFEGISSSLSAIQDRFSTMGIIGMTIIQNLTSSALHAIANVGSKFFGMISQGGIQRAMNIEKAKFQLEGLGIAYQDVYDEIDYAVTNTSFSLDAAAQAAAQLSSAGLDYEDVIFVHEKDQKEITQMGMALRAVSGVAAQTMTDYSMVARYFQDVANAGEVTGATLTYMTQVLNLPVKQDLAEGLMAIADGSYEATDAVRKNAEKLVGNMQISAQDIEEFCKKSQIDFDTFSTIMFNKYADHAVEANKTLTGVIDNIKSAFARIGAEFVGPIVEIDGAVVHMLDSFRKKVNEFKGYIVPFAKETTDAINMVARFMGGAIDKSDLSWVSPFFDGLAGIVKGLNWILLEVGHTFRQVFPKTMPETLKTFADRFKAFGESFGKTYSTFTGLSKVHTTLESFFNMIKSASKVFQIFTSPFKAFVSSFKEWMSINAGRNEVTITLKEIFDGIAKLFDESKKLDSVIENLTWFGGAVGQSMANVVHGIGLVVTAIKNGDIKGALSGMMNGVVGQLGYIVTDFISLLTGIEPDTINVYWEKIYQGISDFILKLVDVFSEGVTGIKDFFNKMKETFGGFKVDTSGFTGFVDEITGKFDPLQAILNFVSGVFNKLTGLLKNAGSMIASVGRGVVTAIKNFISAIGDALEGTNLNKSLETAIGGAFLYNLKNVIMQIVNLIETIKGQNTASTSLKGSITNFFTTLSGAIGEFRKKMSTQYFKDIAMSILMLAFAMNMIAAIDSDKLADATLAIVGLMTTLSVISNSLASEIGRSLPTTSGVLLTMAISISVLASAMQKIAEIPADRLTSAFIAIELLVITMAGISKLLSSTDKTSMMKGASGLIAMALAVRILASAAIVFKDFNWSELAVAGAAIGGLIVALGAFVKFTSSKESGSLFGSSHNAISADHMISIGLGLIALAAAIKIFASAAQDFKEFKWDELAVAGAAITVLLAELTAFTKLTSGSTNMVSIGVGVIAVAAAMKIFASVAKDFQTINWGDLAKAGTAVAGVVAAISILSKTTSSSWSGFWTESNGIVKNNGPQNLIVLGLGLIEFAAAMKIFASAANDFAYLDWGDLAKSGAALAALMVGLSLFSHFTGGSNLLKLSAAMIIFAAALLVLVPAIMAFSNLSLGGVVATLVEIAGIIAILGVAAKLTADIQGSMLKLSAALLLFGAALAAVGAGLILLSAGVTSAVAVIPAVVLLIKETILAVIHAIGDSVTLIVETLFRIVDEVLNSLEDHGPEIVDSLINIFIKVIDVLTSRVPELASSIGKFVKAFMTELGLEFGNINILEFIAFAAGLTVFVLALAEAAKIAQKNLLGVAAISAVLLEVSLMFLILSALNPVEILAITAGLSVTLLALSAAMAIISLIPVAAAAKGVAGLAIVITGLTAILIALGGIRQIPGVDWLMDEGTVMLGKIGNAIGEFVGNIISGFGKGLTSGLPEIGKNLSEFMISITPFIMGTKLIDSEALDGVLKLVAVILALTAANVLDSLTSWFTGGTSFEKFGKELAAFAPHFAAYYALIKDIKPDVVEASANAALALAQMAKTLPKEGGVVELFTGKNSITKFAEELIPFGKAMVKYADAVKGLDVGVVEKSVAAGKAISELASNLPNTGGVAGWFMGENDMDEFGRQLEIFGRKLAIYSINVKDVDPAVVEKSVAAGKAISELANNLPNTGGVVSWFTGDNDMGKFGDQLTKFGQALSTYSSIVSGKDGGNGIDGNVIQKSVEATAALSALAEGLPDTGGVMGWFFGDNDLSKFGEQLVAFGTAISEFSASLAGVDLDKIISIVPGCKELVDLANMLDDIDTEALKKFGKDAASFAKSVKPIGEAGVQGFVDAFIGSMDLVAETIASLIDHMINTLANNVHHFREKGGEFIVAFGNGMKAKEYFARVAATEVCNEVVRVFSQNIYADKFYTYGQYVSDGFARGMESGLDRIRQAADQIVEAADKAIRAKAEIASPSKLFRREGVFLPRGFALGIQDGITDVKEASEEIVAESYRVMEDAISKVFSLLDEGMDYEPTITPVLDMTDVLDKVDVINGLFNKSINVGRINAASTSIPGASQLDNLQNTQSSGNMIFNQYNTSPKALSRIDIYRDTRNLFAQAKGALS